ncbi:hybrid sensor histidine kinase/response regulator [Lichenibacterium dinghuense]|uniref:hybrid sensor histidine kinase/response regulator n=1 Tax=Lichenibacterium dinghuense TaxID=2895977 RepID=UPI001F3A9639|nr:ATP-binding protein [Lichenibacterium sp. 6Y81]
MTRDEGAGGTGDDAVQPAITFPSDPSLDRIAALAADLFGTSSACLILRRKDVGIVAASAGLDGMPNPVPWAFPVSEAAPLAIADLSADTRGAAGSPVTAARRFYAGVPLAGPEGAPRGTLCVTGAEARAVPSPADMDRLRALAGLAGDLLDARAARERAESTAVAKAGLLADVSHEMRTPLNAIVGFTQLLARDGALEGDALRAVERIDQAGRGLLAIVGDALDLSRFESGLVRLDPRPFSLARVVEDAAAMVRAEAERKGLRLVLDLPEPGLGPLLGDPDRLRQVALNLLANAVKFTASGTVRVILSAAPGAGGVIPLTLSVEDTGVGIAAQGLSRLFRRFAQADGAIAREFGGTGLGLAISKSLVEAMGGSIEVESAPGAGARFTVRVALPRAADPRPLPPPRGELAAGRGELRGHAVLVADDAAMNQRLVVQMLEPLGARVDVVADGAAAVDAVAHRSYALVLMDMEMPVLGGLDATRRIRALDGAAGTVPIVALTANAFPEQLDLCHEAGMDDHLTKPFGADDLAAKALRWARRHAPVGGAP